MDEYMSEYLKNKVKNKFYGHEKLNSKYRSRYPESIEREYIRLVDGYMSMYKKMLIKYIEELKKALIAQHRIQRIKKHHADGDEIQELIDNIFKRMSTEIQSKDKSFGLRRKLESLAHMTRELSINEWKKMCKATLGIDILEDYYLGEFYKQTLDIWIQDNINLIVTVPKESLSDMQKIVTEGFKSGSTVTDITKQIQAAYGMSKRHARLIARDQLGKLNAQLAKKQQQEAGVDEYTWSTSRDSRVRDSHRHLEGKTCRWDDPPVVDERTGRRCHPSEDYQCRCIAIPKFNLEGINLPIQKETKERSINNSVTPNTPHKINGTSKRKRNEKKNRKEPDDKNIFTNVVLNNEESFSKYTVKGSKSVEQPNANKVIAVDKHYTRKQLEELNLNELKKIAEIKATNYYKSGKSGISFGNASEEEAAKNLVSIGSKTSLIKDIMSIQRKLK